ncbi:sel1 repeat family protein [Denitromonas iodatirespirans]|uniref:Sel1 repeat family protein n=1 Tax=Denitromonas iodatirespirans TaxID=2795389 RepID=A0A944DD30_DENI1|nr:sel1 repeat family protein [Denitromonas iodatirespirans]MBT0962263.1 sel1 repeat family protein [Denitromonas iodatirespirans]
MTRLPALLLTALLAAPAAADTVPIAVAPERAWRALLDQLDSDGLREHAQLDLDRFEGRLQLPEAGTVEVSVDWDETTGGTRLDWHLPAPQARQRAAAERWMGQVADRAPHLPRPNHLCRGPETAAGAPDTDVYTLKASCQFGTGHFSSALFELEKCGDYESALVILAACVRERHAGGLVRLAQFFESGLGVPRRPERMTDYLRQAEASHTPGYSQGARVQYATALYFGVGTAPDREAALRLFKAAASAGDRDARDFLAHGVHYAWRREDGSVYADPAWTPLTDHP